MRDGTDTRTLDIITGGMRIGYARVSTQEQNLDLQRDALRAAACATVYEEKISGGRSRAERPELDNALKALRKGDTLVVWRLDRLGRSLAHLVQIVTDLNQRGIALESLTEKIDTSTASGKLITNMFAVLAEYDRNLTRERTLAGLKSARARGRTGGRPPKIGVKEIREINVLLADPHTTIKDVASRYGVSRTTIYKHIKGSADNSRSE
ncbi:recombinase family protein [Burkholderia cenocepacia]|uniref:recombinase family protein n=1 Tax=Burkholderia TaxID=32008 RepID=UPI000F5BF66C|nr:MULTISPECIES: recombinase family protein [Burkholderia]RQU99191.1 recombinase family protein [Burkholderia cenocepacia]